MSALQLASQPVEPSVRDAWAQEALSVAIARASSWRDIAVNARDAHEVAVSALLVPGSTLLQQMRHEIHARHHFNVLVETRREIADALARLPGYDVPPDIQFQRDAIDLTCEELDHYLAQAALCAARPK